MVPCEPRLENLVQLLAGPLYLFSCPAGNHHRSAPSIWHFQATQLRRNCIYMRRSMSWEPRLCAGLLGTQKSRGSTPMLVLFLDSNAKEPVDNGAEDLIFLEEAPQLPHPRINLFYSPRKFWHIDKALTVDEPLLLRACTSWFLRLWLTVPRQETTNTFPFALAVVASSAGTGPIKLGHHRFHREDVLTDHV